MKSQNESQYEKPARKSKIKMAKRKAKTKSQNEKPKRKAKTKTQNEKQKQTMKNEKRISFIYSTFLFSKNAGDYQVP
jgi:hypothetical protein